MSVARFLSRYHHFSYFVRRPAREMRGATRLYKPCTRAHVASRISPKPNFWRDYADYSSVTSLR
jgi:hypothetical protein